MKFENFDFLNDSNRGKCKKTCKEHQDPDLK